MGGVGGNHTELGSQRGHWLRTNLNKKRIMKNTLSNNKSRFLSILVVLAAILSPIAVHAQDSYLFASVNGNTQNFGGAVFQYTPSRSVDEPRNRLQAAI